MSRGPALALLLSTVGCGAFRSEYPPPPTEPQLGELEITEGIAGRASMRTGDCSPGWRYETCLVQRVPMELRAYETDRLVASQGECRLQIGEIATETGFQLLTDGPPAATEDLRAVEVYELPLAPGDYTLVLVDPRGCARCVRSPEGSTICESTTVLPQQVTIVDVLLDFSVQ